MAQKDMLQPDTELMDTAHSRVHSWAQQPNQAWQRHWEPVQQDWWKNPPQCPGQADRQWTNRASCPLRARALGHPLCL